MHAPTPTYGKSRKLARTTLTEDGQDLRQLARRANNPSPYLQILQQLHVDDVRVEKHETRAGQRRDQHRAIVAFARELEHQKANRDILDEDEGRFSVRTEGEVVADVVHQADAQGSCFEQVAGEGYAFATAAVAQLRDLRHLR